MSRENISIQGKSELSAQFSAWARLGYIPIQLKSNVKVMSDNVSYIPTAYQLRAATVLFWLPIWQQ
jgi:hypothetical protein